MLPDVRAAGSDIDRDIAEELDVFLRRVLPKPFPLEVENVLHIKMIMDLFLKGAEDLFRFRVRRNGVPPGSQRPFVKPAVMPAQRHVLRVGKSPGIGLGKAFRFLLNG